MKNIIAYWIYFYIYSIVYLLKQHIFVLIDYRTCSWREDAFLRITSVEETSTESYSLMHHFWHVLESRAQQRIADHFQVILEVPYVETSPDAIDWYEGMNLKICCFFLYLPCSCTEIKDDDSHQKHNNGYGSWLVSSVGIPPGWKWQSFWREEISWGHLPPFLRIVPLQITMKNPPWKGYCFLELLSKHLKYPNINPWNLELKSIFHEKNTHLQEIQSLFPQQRCVCVFFLVCSKQKHQLPNKKCRLEGFFSKVLKHVTFGDVWWLDLVIEGCRVVIYGFVYDEKGQRLATKNGINLFEAVLKETTKIWWRCFWYSVDGWFFVMCTCIYIHINMNVNGSFSRFGSLQNQESPEVFCFIGRWILPWNFDVSGRWRIQGHPSR